MSSLTDNAGVGRSDVIPGQTLMPLRPADFGILQQNFQANLLKVAAMAADDLPPAMERRIMSAATACIAEGQLHYGSPGFDYAMYSIDNLPALLCQCLKEKQPRTTVAGAMALITDSNRVAILQGCLEMAGYVKKKEEPSTPQSKPPGTGTPSTPPSESAG